MILRHYSSACTTWPKDAWAAQQFLHGRESAGWSQHWGGSLSQLHTPFSKLGAPFFHVVGWVTAVALSPRCPSLSTTVSSYVSALALSAPPPPPGGRGTPRHEPPWAQRPLLAWPWHIPIPYREVNGNHTPCAGPSLTEGLLHSARMLIGRHSFR